MQQLLTTWFSVSPQTPNTRLWFSHLSTRDDSITEQFESLVKSALNSDSLRNEWTTSPEGKLAYIILCDQLPRFLFLGTQKIFSLDEQAFQIADSFAYSEEATKMPLLHQYFLLEPFYHSENFEKLAEAQKYLEKIIKQATDTLPDDSKIVNFLQYRNTHFQQNMDVLKQFSRYPHRNDRLGRKTTVEEITWLGSNKNWFLRKLIEPGELKKVKSKIEPNNKTEGLNIPLKRKLRILALHGMKQNSILFRSRTAKLRMATKDFAEIIYVSGPHEYQNNTQHAEEDILANVSQTESKCWWHVIENEDGTVEYVGLDTSIQLIENIFQTQGPFDGILGFSQGAALAGILSSLQPTRDLQFSFVVEISGFIPRNLYEEKMRNGVKCMPSLHIYGLADKLVAPERTQELAECFVEPSGIVSKHEGTHFAPNKWPLDVIAKFIKEQHETLTKNDVVPNYADIHTPIKSFSRKIEATMENAKPAGLHTSLQQWLKQSEEWSTILKQRPHVSLELVQSFINALVTDTVVLENCNSQELVEDLFVLAWSLRTVARETPEPTDLCSVVILAVMKHFPAETLQILQEIPNYGSWKDLSHFLEVVGKYPELQPLRPALFDRIVEIFVEQLKEDQNKMAQLISNNSFVKFSIGQLQEDGLWPSRCGAEAPRIGTRLAKVHRLPQAIAKQLNPLHIPPGLDIDSPDAKEALSYTKGICYARYQKLCVSLKRITNRVQRDNFIREEKSHKQKVLMAKMSDDAWQELLQAPLSSEILHPRPQPVVPCELEQLDPLLDWLQKNEIPVEQTAFTKGTIVPDGRLDLCKQVIGPQGIDPLLCSMTGNEQVKRLLLGNNIIGDEGAKSIAKAIHNNAVPNMDTWYIAGNNISEVGIQPICEALYSSVNIKALWLKRNPLLPAGVRHVAGLLKHNRSIVTLDLDNCGVLDEGVSYLVEGLKENPTVLHLYLGVNGITHEGVSTLAQYLATPSASLATLFLSVNRVGDKGCEILSTMFEKNVHLRRLSLASNRIGDKGVEALVNGLIASKHPLSLLDLGFTKSTWAVRELGNRIGDDGAKSLARLLENNSTLHSLFLLNNIIEDEGILALSKALESNSTLTSVGTTQFYSQNELLPRHLLSNIQRNKDTLQLKDPDIEFVDLPDHVREIYSVYRTKSAAQEPFLHKFNWLQAADLGEIIPDQ